MSAKINKIRPPEDQILEVLGRDRNRALSPEAGRLPQAEVDAALQRIGIQHLFGDRVGDEAVSDTHLDLEAWDSEAAHTENGNTIQNDREFLRSVGIDSDKIVDWVEEILDGDWEAPSTEARPFTSEAQEVAAAPSSKDVGAAYLQDWSPIYRSAVAFLAAAAVIVLCVFAVYDYKYQENFDKLSDQITQLHVENKIDLQKKYEEIVSLMQTKEGVNFAGVTSRSIVMKQQDPSEFVFFSANAKGRKLASWQVITPPGFSLGVQVSRNERRGAALDQSQIIDGAASKLKLRSTPGVKQVDQSSECDSWSRSGCLSTASLNGISETRSAAPVD